MKIYTVVVITAIVLFGLWAGTPSAADPFSDLPGDHWACEAVKTLVEKGIIIGFPEGTFRGEYHVSRYELAATLARTLDRIGITGEQLDAADQAGMEKLVREFGEELVLLGFRVEGLEESIQSARVEAALLKSEPCQDRSGDCYGPGRRFGNIVVTGDSWLHIDHLRYYTDTADDDVNTFYRIGLNFAANVDENVSTFVRVANDDLSGMKFDSAEDTTFGLDLAYIDVNDIVRSHDLRFGRQFVRVGHGIVLNDKLDAVTFSGRLGDVDMLVLAAEQADNGVNENGFNLTGFDLAYRWEDNLFETYYLTTSTVDGDPVTYGLSLDGPFYQNIDYFAEYARYDADDAETATGSAWVAGFVWDYSPEIDATLLYARGDEEFQPVSIYYWRRFQDMYGNMSIGALPAGRTRATGSLQDMKELLFKLDYIINDKLDAVFIHEKIKENSRDNPLMVGFDYKRRTIGFDYRYAPRTTLGLKYDYVEFDKGPENLVTNGGGWSRYRLEVITLF